MDFRAFAVVLAWSVVALAAGAPLVSGGKADCVIVCGEDDTRAARRLAEYLGEHAGAKPEIVGAEKSDAAATVVRIDGSGTAAELPVGDSADRYAIKVSRQGEKWIVLVAGGSASGAKYAVYRLMEEMEVEAGTSASVREMEVKASPFFGVRSVSLFNIWRCPVEVVRQCNLESWPVEKIQTSIDMYDAFGFNTVETHDRFHEDFLKAVYGVTRAEWREKVHALCDRAHADGMTVFLRLWGNAVALPVKKLEGGYTPFGYVNLAPDIPEERKRWEAEIRDYASKNYAGHIDHLIGHWADASGVHPGSKATIADAIELHNELVSAFRAINPKMESSFNLWGMKNPRGKRGWPGYKDYTSVADAAALPKDVMIAQTTRAHSHNYDQSVTDGIIAAGHPAAVWTWRRADTEVRFGDVGLRIRIHDVMGDYFRALPAGAAKLAWHNIERNHHGLANDVNYYVCGKLMWDPKADVDAVVRKYCALVFGEKNAEAVREAFYVIEMARHLEKQVSDEMVAKPAEGAARARKALEALKKVELTEGHRSRLPSVISPAEQLAQLRGALGVIAENGRIMAEELPEIEKLKKEGKDVDERVAELKKQADAWFGTVDGGVEGLWLKERLAGK